MSKKIIKESFPGQPEDKDIVTGVSTPFKQANKEHDENVKNAEEAMDSNKEAVDLVYGDNTKKKEGNFKNDALKKMHLSENLFKSNFDEDYGYNEEDRITEIIDQLQYALDDVMEDACGEDEIDKSKRISKSALMKEISNLFSQASNRYFFTENYIKNESYTPDSVTPYKDMLHDEVESGNGEIILKELLAYISEDDARDVLNNLDLLDYYEEGMDESLTESSQREWADYKERCSDCIALVEKDNRWFCDEAKDFCENVKCCPEGLGCLKEEEVELNEDTDSVFDKIAKKLAPSMGVSEDLKKNK